MFVKATLIEKICDIEDSDGVHTGWLWEQKDHQVHIVVCDIPIHINPLGAELFW